MPKFNLHTNVEQSINTLQRQVNTIFTFFLIKDRTPGDEENRLSSNYTFTDILLGPEGLGTETTVLTDIITLQRAMR
ncbi:MAG: hypothetical protein ACMUEK_01175 [Sodalis sp. (in: enterobacteria)]